MTEQDQGKEKAQEEKKERKKEISAGLVVVRRTPEGPKFLILYHRKDYWNFPKGKIENEEKSFQAALRETEEETGIPRRSLRVVRNFKVYERFTFRRGSDSVFKVVIFYLAYTSTSRVNVSEEHQGYGWFLFRDGLKILGKHRESQKVLQRAYDFVNGGSKKKTGDSGKQKRREQNAKEGKK